MTNQIHHIFSNRGVQISICVDCNRHYVRNNCRVASHHLFNTYAQMFLHLSWELQCSLFMLISVMEWITSSKIEERAYNLHYPPQMNSHHLQQSFSQVIHLAALHMQITVLNYLLMYWKALNHILLAIKWELNQHVLPRFPFTFVGSFFSFDIPKTSKQRSFIEVETCIMSIHIKILEPWYSKQRRM